MCVCLHTVYSICVSKGLAANRVWFVLLNTGSVVSAALLKLME